MRQVMALAEAPASTLFLLDEIFHGTNSHDRGIGAEAVVRGLVERGAVGLVTTHDLALARLSDVLQRRGSEDQRVVKIVKEPISSKGSRITSHVTLAGRFLVLVPFYQSAVSV